MNNLKNKKGFVLYIVIVVLLGLALLAFALNEFKRGAVIQLTKNVDQNRLIQLCKSANNEVMAMIRSRVNEEPNSSLFNDFRKVFKSGSSSNIVLFENFVPEQTVKLADESGYLLDIKSKATLHIYKKAAYSSVSAYNAYLNIYTTAFKKGNPKNSIKTYERHDVRLVDLRCTLDRYALFVKNYSTDLNNTQRRIIIQGIEPQNNYISRVFLGNGNYPENKAETGDQSERIWLDLCYNEVKDMPGFKNIFTKNTREKFKDNSGQSVLFYSNQVKFRDDSSGKSINLPKNLFHHVSAVKKVYEVLVNQAADGCMNKTEQVDYQKDANRAVGEQLKSKCDEAMNHTNSNAAAYRICEDYVKNFKKSTYDGKTVNDYSACKNFDSILETCMKNWVYHYGYLDASAVWKVSENEFPSQPAAQSWVTALAYQGLVVKNDDNNNMGSYFYGYYKSSSSKPYHPERYRVGQMLRLYGDNNKTKVLVEGPVYLRFFKIGFFNDFDDELEFYNNVKKNIHPETVPILFRRIENNGNKTFQNTTTRNFAPSDYFVGEDNTLMSRQIDNIPINALLLGNGGSGLTFYNYKGQNQTTTLSKAEVYKSTNPFVKPAQPDNANVKSWQFGRKIDYEKVSYNYHSSKEFLADRTKLYNGKKTLFVDGIMYIEQGDMDLVKEDINYFYGKGLIYLADGNIIMGNFERIRDIEKGDSVRFYLRHGDYILGSGNSDINIEASLAAINYMYNKNNDPKEQGSLNLNGKKNVSIFGNLCVDSLFTQASGNSLQKGGTLRIEHDALVLEPEAAGKDPYRVSIGKVKTAFAIDAEGSDN